MPKTEDSEGPAAKWGKEVHRWKETGVPPTPRVSKWLAEQKEDPEQIRTRVWPGGHHEIMLKLEENGEVWAEEASTEERRKAFFSTGMIRGIADWVGLSVVWAIKDLKTGRWPPPHPAGETEQLLLYADIWLQLHKREPGVLLELDHWPRYPKGLPPRIIGPDWVTREQVLDWHHTKLIPARRLALKKDAALDTRPGDWCQFCRSAPWCTAQGGTPP